MQIVDQSVPAVAASPAEPPPKPAAGIEGQRKADLGDGTYLNPIVAGDHPDPTVLKDRDDYYMTFSSFFSYPGVIIWHSRDLVNWAPVGPTLTKPLGSVWAMDLIKHNGRYFIYIPASPDGRQSIFVIHADNIHGPWSDPIDLKWVAVAASIMATPSGEERKAISVFQRRPQNCP